MQCIKSEKLTGKRALFVAITLTVLAIAAIILVITLPKVILKKSVGNTAEETQSETLQNNMFSTIADQSEMNLYLTQTYGKDILQECKYYEFFTTDNHYILVEAVKDASGLETETSGIPKYVLFSYSGNHIPLFECQRYDMGTATTVNSEKENVAIYRLTFPDDENVKGGSYEIYISCRKGNVEKLVLTTGFWITLFRYQYNQDGSVSTLVVDGIINNEWDINSIILKEDSKLLGAYKTSIDFSYNEDRSLAKASVRTSISSDEKEYEECYQFEYEDGKRSCTTFDNNSGEVKRIDYTRDDHGLVKTADVAWSDSNGQFMVNYYDNGRITISSNSDLYPASDTERLSAADLKFIPAQKLNGGGTIEEGAEGLTYDEEDVLLDGTYIESATAQVFQTPTDKDEYVLSVKFNEEGTKIFQKITRDMIGQQICVLYYNRVLCAPLIQSEIKNGQAVISGGFQSLEEAEELAAVLSK